MANNQSYTLTFDNIKSEKEALSFLISSNSNFLNPDKESRKIIMEMLSIEKNMPVLLI